MKKILLDGKEILTLVPNSLPMLIHGKEGSGASLYTICLASQWYRHGYKILFLCGFPMAEKEFAKELENDYLNAKFYTKAKTNDFFTALKDIDEKTIVIVKNFELFDDEVFIALNSVEKLIISGDVSKAKVKEKLLHKKFVTKIYFSPLDGKDLPEVKKFQGVVISGDYHGITQLSLY